MKGITGHRPPAYLSRTSLAAELDCAESTVDEMVRRGILPRPVRLSGNCVRWEWEAVRAALASLSAPLNNGQPADPQDPAMAGVLNVSTTAERRRGAA